MADTYIFVVDVGTSSLKAAIMDRDLNIIEHAQGHYAYSVVENMGVEIDPEDIWNAFVKVARMFSSYADQIDVIALCTFCPAMTPMDAEGKALRNSIIHLDRRTYPQARRALKRVGEQRFLHITGNLPYPGGVSLTSLLWIQENEPDFFRSTTKFGHMNTFLMKRLVDRWLIDPTNASMTGFYETVVYGDWSSEITEIFGINMEKLPDVVDCDQFVGGLTKTAAEALHLKAGTPVIMGGGDTACATYGAGGEDEGEILDIAGSSEILTVTLKTPYPSKKYNLRTHVLRDRWVIFTITVGGIALEWFRAQFCRDMEKKTFYDQYLPEVLQETNSTEVFHPHLSGNRFSMVQQKGVFSGLTLKTTREDLIRAVAKGVMKPMEVTLAECQKHIQLRKSVFLTGGGANEALKHYKEHTVFSGYTFTLRKECSLVGVAKLAVKFMRETS
jgi:xylulokinase